MEDTRRDQQELQVTASDRTPTAKPLPHLLDEAASRVAGIGGKFASQAAALRSLQERLSEQRFHLAVLGQFKRGKSTLLNALLGEEVLPASIIPLTAIPTFVRAGEERRARVIFGNDDPPIETEAANAIELNEFLIRYVAEEANPANRLGVSWVEVMHPASILRAGVVLIDTPGIGSTHLHNTEATLNFIPQCDAALFVISPDPPVTEVEVEFLRQVRSRISRVFFVLSKADYLSDMDRRKILDFLRGVLHEQAGVESDAPILAVSARTGLEAKRDHREEEWARSGMQEVESLLRGFLIRERDSALAEAIARKASDLTGDVLLELRLSAESVRMPLDELARRLEMLRARLSEAESRRTAERDTLEGDKKRMAALLEDQAEQLRKAARKQFARAVRDALEKDGLSTEAATTALAGVTPAFFERELGEISRVFEGQVRDALNRHREHIVVLIESIRKTAAELFDIPHQPLTSGERFEMKKQPCWVTHHSPISLGVLPEGFWDRLLPRGMRKSRMLRRMRERIEALIAENVESVRWPTLQNLEKGFREFGIELDSRLEEAVAATEGAIKTVYEKRTAQSAAIESEASRLEDEIAALERIDAELRAMRSC